MSYLFYVACHRGVWHREQCACVAAMAARWGATAVALCSSELAEQFRREAWKVCILPMETTQAVVPDEMARRICDAVKASDENVVGIVAGHNPTMLAVLSLCASYLRIPFIANVQNLHKMQMERLMCASRVVERLSEPAEPFCATLAQNVQLQSDDGGAVPLVGDLRENACRADIPKALCVSFEWFEQGDVSLEAARLVFAGGRGLGCAKNFQKLIECAQKFGASVAASRCAVDLGWARNDWQVGQTGKTIAPEIYVAFGISGAIQHLSGMFKSRRIIAINTDKDAPIFEIADEGICADAVSVLDRLLALR